MELKAFFLFFSWLWYLH